MVAPKPFINFLCLVAMTAIDSIAYAGGERADLELIIGQLQNIDQISKRAENSSGTGARYQFDYTRFRQDITRIESGLHDFLAPSRAQPSDPTKIIGDYTEESLRELAP